MPSADRTTLHDLRRTRQQHRLGEVEWFDVAYRVYLVALVGFITVVVASDVVSGLLGDDVTVAQWVERAPSVLGIVVAVAFALGLRSGAEGGPVTIEVADVRHVLMAPVDRRLVMALPIAQRLRSVMFGLAVVGAVLAQLVARELETSRGGWAAAGALFGAVVGAVFVATAVVAHALHVPRWLASAVGVVAVAWQCAAAWAVWHDSGPTVARIGPANLDGSLALWGERQRLIDVVALALTAVLIAAALALGGSLRIEPLMRRGRLVSQLRFAATAQDLRTVVLLRRQLRAESLRQRPWGGGADRRRRGRTPDRTGGSATATSTDDPVRPAIVWRRGVSSLRRLPAARYGRIVVLALAAGVTASLTVTSSPLFAFALLAALFLLGMEVIEPLSQEVDRPTLTDRHPVERGWLFSHHLAAPAAMLAVVAVFGVAGATAVAPSHAAAAAALAVPVALAGAAGPVVATVRDAPRPIGAGPTLFRGSQGGDESPLVPPEFAGASTVLSTLVPVAISAVGTVPVLAMRVEGSPSTVVRSVVGIAVFALLVVTWVRRRDAWTARVGAFVAEGRAAR